MIAYRAETSMAHILREPLARNDDVHALLRGIFNNEADLTPDLVAKTLTVKLHYLSEDLQDDAVRYLCEKLNETETTFPGTNLRMIYKLGSK